MLAIFAPPSPSIVASLVLANLRSPLSMATVV